MSVCVSTFVQLNWKLLTEQGLLNNLYIVLPSLCQFHLSRIAGFMYVKQGINYEIMSEDGLHIQRAARKGYRTVITLRCRGTSILWRVVKKGSTVHHFLYWLNSRDSSYDPYMSQKSRENKFFDKYCTCS